MRLLITTLAIIGLSAAAGAAPTGQPLPGDKPVAAQLQEVENKMKDIVAKQKKIEALLQTIPANDPHFTKTAADLRAQIAQLKREYEAESRKADALRKAAANRPKPTPPPPPAPPGKPPTQATAGTTKPPVGKPPVGKPPGGKPPGDKPPTGPNDGPPKPADGGTKDPATGPTPPAATPPGTTSGSGDGLVLVGVRSGTAGARSPASPPPPPATPPQGGEPSSNEKRLKGRR